MVATTLGRTFFDSNVLVYAFDDSAPAKQKQAQELLNGVPIDSLVLSTQVLGEFYWTATRKIPAPLTRAEARSVVNWLSDFLIIPIEKGIVLEALALCESAQIAYWDALIVAAAKSAGCTRILSGDLNHGQVIDGVRIENPFLDASQAR